MKKNYTLEIRNYNNVLIEENRNLVEYSVEVDTETIQIKEWHGEKDEHFRLLMNKEDTTARWIGNPEYYISEQAIAEAKKIVEKQIKKLRVNLKEMKTNPLWKKMEEYVDDQVKNYKSDFYFHDTLWLYKNPGRKFLWIVRECGTWLLCAVTGFSECIVRDDNGRNSYFYYDGNKLSEITLTELSNKFYTELPNLKKL